MPDDPNTVISPRQLSLFGKTLLVVLVVYAVALILPDTLRPTAFYKVAYYLEGLGPGPRSTASSWYPLGMVCFTADNDGKVTSVDDCGRGPDQLREGDRIDLGGGRFLDVMYTPGHAKHLMCLVDSETGGVFVGDAVGITLPGSHLVRPTVPPPDIDTDLLVSQLGRLTERGVTSTSCAWARTSIGRPA